MFATSTQQASRTRSGAQQEGPLIALLQSNKPVSVQTLGAAIRGCAPAEPVRPFGRAIEPVKHSDKEPKTRTSQLVRLSVKSFVLDSETLPAHVIGSVLIHRLCISTWVKAQVSHAYDAGFSVFTGVGGL